MLSRLIPSFRTRARLERSRSRSCLKQHSIRSSDQARLEQRREGAKANDSLGARHASPSEQLCVRLSAAERRFSTAGYRACLSAMREQRAPRSYLEALPECSQHSISRFLCRCLCAFAATLAPLCLLAPTRRTAACCFNLLVQFSELFGAGRV